MNAAKAKALPVLQGIDLVLTALMLAMVNFIVVLDTTIANVSVPHIAGALAVSASQGTYVITSYSVAEAIAVPLTGWLAARFGMVRTYITCILMFGVCSLLCGLAPSLGMLVVFRVMQGLFGGPLMPLSQTLLMKIFPKEKIPTAMALWSMTTLLAPIMGPILGGWICDNWTWEYIFWINVPLTAICGFMGWQQLKRFNNTPILARVDFVGLGLLIATVAPFQIMLDKGKDLDWFNSNIIIGLAVTAAIGLASFLIWELTEENPIVNLRVFRHRGYASAVITISLAFGAYFAATVLTPLWLQSQMGYTATWSGMTTAATGVFAVIAAPIAAKMAGKYDKRKLVFWGLAWISAMTFIRSFSTSQMTQWQIAAPLLFQGIGMPFFFVPLTGLALSSVNEDETASAAGLLSFMRTTCGAFAASLVTTAWENDTNRNHAELSGLIDPLHEAARALRSSGFGTEQIRQMIDQMVQNESVMLATNHIFLIAAFSFVASAIAIWFAPKPTRVADTSEAH
jgi:DHA2 family multidrug resistance protein